MKSRYTKKIINSGFYGIIRITGEAEETKILTREEFRERKQGIIFIDNKTGKIVFNDGRKS
jgi:hypothetical protein